VINAAIMVLQNMPAPAPFSIKDKKEALFLLAHFVGDLHQPMHVSAIYLDPNGNFVDADSGVPYDPNTQTLAGV
jgi:S1/P1 Nuclease